MPRFFCVKFACLVLVGKKLKTDVPMEYNRQEDMDEKAYKSAMLKICNSIVGLCLGIIVSIIFMVFIYNANYIQSLWIQIAYIVIPLIILLIEIWSYISIIIGLGCLVKAVNKNDIMAIKCCVFHQLYLELHL